MGDFFKPSDLIPCTFAKPHEQQGCTLPHLKAWLRFYLVLISKDHPALFEDCKTGLKLKTATTSGERCVFPFKYDGIDYDSCTYKDNGETPWCATTVTSDGAYDDWGNCDTLKCHSGNSNNY